MSNRKHTYHPVYPLTPQNRRFYRKLLKAKAELSACADIDRKVELRAIIGQCTAEIRRCKAAG